MEDLKLDRPQSSMKSRMYRGNPEPDFDSRFQRMSRPPVLSLLRDDIISSIQAILLVVIQAIPLNLVDNKMPGFFKNPLNASLMSAMRLLSMWVPLLRNIFPLHYLFVEE